MEADLFGAADDTPAGLRYAPEVISADEERRLLRELPKLPFKEFEFQGFLGKRRTVSYGWRYDFNGGGLQKTDALPDFLEPLRERAARFAGLDASALCHALLLEYRPGAGIGWHRDRPAFDDVIGISLLAPCVFRLRLKLDEADLAAPAPSRSQPCDGAIARRRGSTKWQRHSFTAEPRSAYLLRGPSRTAWEHSIPPLDTLRYSVTFRSMQEGAGRMPRPTPPGEKEAPGTR
jgi:alkylated DNA repair dioxygenase AlkB